MLLNTYLSSSAAQKRSSFPNSDIKTGDVVIVPARPDWGVVEVVDASDPAMVSVYAGSQHNASIVRIGRAAIRLYAEAELASNAAISPPNIIEDSISTSVISPSHHPNGSPNVNPIHPEFFQTATQEPIENEVVERLLKALRQPCRNRDDLANALAEIEALPCMRSWSNELLLGRALGVHDDPCAKRLAIIRFSNAYQLSAGAIPFSVKSATLSRNEILDRCDIACQIGQVAFVNQQAISEIASDVIDIGLSYLREVFSRTERYYPNLYLYAYAYHKRGDYASAADIAIELHRRAGIACGNLPYSSWEWTYQMPRTIATEALHMLTSQYRRNGDPLGAIRSLNRLVQLGVRSDAILAELDELRSQHTVIAPIDDQPLVALNSANLTLFPEIPSSLERRSGRSSTVDRLAQLLEEAGEPVHYSVMVDIYQERFGEITSRQVCDILNGRSQIFRQIADGTYTLIDQASEKRHWLLDVLSEIAIESEENSESDQ